jgi:hypothetical protein
MRNTNEQDLALPAPESMPIVRGVVGWSTASDHADVGTADDDGHTLVRVTLFHSKPITKDPETGKAQGHEILCQVMGPLYYIPPDGAVVMVAFPDGHNEAPGAGVIIGTIGGTPAIQFSTTRAVLDIGPDMDLMIKGKSVTCSDHASPAQFFQVGPPPQGGTSGISMCDSSGNGITIQNTGSIGIFCSDSGAAKTLIQLTPTSFEVWQADGSNLTLKDGDAHIIGANVYAMGSGVYLGQLPTALTKCAYNATPGSAFLVSNSVYISPT